MPPFFHSGRIAREAEGLSGGAPAAAPVAVAVAAPVAAQPVAAPAHVEPAQRRTDADWRADVAAQRVERERQEIRANTAEAAIISTRADGDRRVTEANAAHAVRAEAMQARMIDTEMRSAATAAGILDMDLMPLVGRGAIKMDAEGNVTGVAEAIAAFKANKPAFFAAADPVAAAAAATAATAAAALVAAAAARPPINTGSGANPPANPNAPLVDVKAMSKKDYDAWFKSAVKQAARA